eukprot:13676933-Alexandrium_andersonii.AAC.1
MGEQEVARRAAAARTRLKFMVKLYWAQLERGAHFIPRALRGNPPQDRGQACQGRTRGSPARAGQAGP